MVIYFKYISVYKSISNSQLILPPSLHPPPCNHKLILYTEGLGLAPPLPKWGQFFFPSDTGNDVWRPSGSLKGEECHTSNAKRTGVLLKPHTAAVPNLFGTRDGFMEDGSYTDQERGWSGDDSSVLGLSCT